MTNWSEVAGQFARHSRDLPIDEQVWDYLRNLPDDCPVLVACSGGADSVLLVFLLLSRLPSARERLHVCHFNHGIRGEAADADAGFVVEMAESLGLQVSVGRAESGLPSTEAALREARYSWLTRIYTDSGAGCLCLGHHADDVLESQLMALFSGTGPAGMAAPLGVKHFGDGHVRLRPLLNCRKAQIHAVLRSAGIPWREDLSNTDISYTRNWIRRELLPQIQERFPQDILSGSQRTRRLMAEAVESIDTLLEQINPETASPDSFPVNNLAGRPRAVVRRAVLGWWLQHRPSERLESAAFDALVDSIVEGRREASISIGPADRLFLDREGILHYQTRPAREIVHWGNPASWSWASGPVYLPNGARLEASIFQWTDKLPVPYRNADPRREAWLSTEAAVFSIRQWQPGDRYRPLGAPGSRKLQDLFTDAKLKPEQKHQLPVLLSGARIAWVPGFPPNEALKVPPSANSALKLTYIR